MLGGIGEVLWVLWLFALGEQRDPLSIAEARQSSIVRRFTVNAGDIQGMLRRVVSRRVDNVTHV